MMKFLSKLAKEKIQGKRCLVRVNLDISDQKKESLRIETALPTILHLLNNGSEVTILAHRGRPQGIDETLSIKPLISILEKKIGTSLKYIENVRFDVREQENNSEYARELSLHADFYVNNDFATSHRKHASVAAIAAFLPSYAGLQLEKEINTLTHVRDNPEKPLVVIMGGIKIEDKVGVIKHLYDRTHYFLMGSAYLNRDIQKNPLLTSEKVIIPIDWETRSGNRCDIGPKTIQQYQEYIAQARTIIWNGPVGRVEDQRCTVGSTTIVHAIADSDAFSVIGGGETEQFIRTLNRTNDFDFISTGGGAMLSLLSGEILPGVEALESNTLSL